MTGWLVAIFYTDRLYCPIWPKQEKMKASTADMICDHSSSCVSGIDSELGLTTVRSRLQSAPELPALDLPPISKHVRWICGNYLRFLTSGDPDLWLFDLRRSAEHLGATILDPKNWLSFCPSVLTKEPEMLQPDAFCKHTMQQNATAIGALPQTPLWELTALPQTI